MTSAKRYNYYVVEMSTPDKFDIKTKFIPKTWIRKYQKDGYVTFRYPSHRYPNESSDWALAEKNVPPTAIWPCGSGRIIFKCDDSVTGYNFMVDLSEADVKSMANENSTSDEECEPLKFDEDETEENVHIENIEIEDIQNATRKRERLEENDEQSSKENNQPKIRRLSNNLNKTIEEMDEHNTSTVSNNQNSPKFSKCSKRDSKNMNSKTFHNMKESLGESLTTSDKVTLEENATDDGNTELHQDFELTEERAEGKKTVEKADKDAQTETQTANEPSFEQLLESCGVNAKFIKNGNQSYSVDDVKHVYNTILESKIKFKSVYEEIRMNLRNAFATIGLEVPDFCDRLI